MFTLAEVMSVLPLSQLSRLSCVQLQHRHLSWLVISELTTHDIVQMPLPLNRMLCVSHRYQILCVSLADYQLAHFSSGNVSILLMASRQGTTGSTNWPYSCIWLLAVLVALQST